jgi:hypothetical protein
MALPLGSREDHNALQLHSLPAKWYLIARLVTSECYYHLEKV